MGEIERQLDWPLRIRQAGPLDGDDFYSQKLRREIDEQNAVFVAVNQDEKTMIHINKEMKAFISAIFGNDGWIKLVEARSLRLRQAQAKHEYDPKDLHAVKVYQ